MPAVVVSQIIFTAGWVVGGLVQTGAYSSARHDISDLGALTAQAPWILLIAQAIAGVVTIAFALVALRPALQAPGHHDPISAWLVAASLMGLDNITDPFFRLDCRAADPGCTAAVAAASWHGTLHVAFGMIAALATVVAPFALARRMRLIPEWRSVAPRAIAFGIVFALLLVSYALLAGRTGQGYAQRAMCLTISAGVIALAVKCSSIPSAAARGTRHS